MRILTTIHSALTSDCARACGARAGPFLLAHIVFCKYGLHLPLNRQSATYAREGVELGISSRADIYRAAWEKARRAG